jgi:hypothetical protein
MSLKLEVKIMDSDEYHQALLSFTKRHQDFCSLHLSDLCTDEGNKLFDNLSRSFSSFIGTFDETTPELLANVLVNHNIPSTWPDCITTYVKEAWHLALPRKVQNNLELPLETCNLTAMGLKKRMEVDRLTNLIVSTGKQLKIDLAIDIGSGNGHLSNNLSTYFPVISVEQFVERVDASREKMKYFTNKRFEVIRLNREINQDNVRELLDDVELDIMINRTKSIATEIENENVSIEPSNNIPNDDGSVNIPFQSTKDIKLEELDVLYDRKPKDQWRILITGLHACGDLSSLTIPALFETSSQFICAIYVGCCYQRKNVFYCRYNYVSIKYKIQGITI